MQIRDAYAESKKKKLFLVICNFITFNIERFTEIERENKKLLNKMSEILGKTQPSFGSFHQSK